MELNKIPSRNSPEHMQNLSKKDPKLIKLRPRAGLSHEALPRQPQEGPRTDAGTTSTSPLVPRDARKLVCARPLGQPWDPECPPKRTFEYKVALETSKKALPESVPKKHEKSMNLCRVFVAF